MTFKLKNFSGSLRTAIELCDFFMNNDLSIESFIFKGQIVNSSAMYLPRKRKLQNSSSHLLGLKINNQNVPKLIFYVFVLIYHL